MKRLWSGLSPSVTSEKLMIFSEKIDKILSVGKPLMDEGIDNWALNKQQCLQAIKELSNNNIAILGGDTFLNGRVNPNGDSWSCNRNNAESDISYLKRTTTESLNFIENPAYKEFSFIIVPDNS